ncbi:MAG: IPT/TIG domain-containing protein [Desulfuromonadales bacterium]|nr:IPT/TIG domain-containing protein [Desulfuromonadales bacterium]
MRRLNLMLMSLLTALLFTSSTAWSEGTEYRFVDLNDGTVFDINSGLRWLKNANCFGNQNIANLESNSNALASASCGLSDGSVAGDWHLPSFSELSIFKSYIAVNLNNDGFVNVQPDIYWSDSRFTDSGDYGYVDISSHTTGTDFQFHLHYGWPVRGGQYSQVNDFIMVGTADFGTKAVNGTPAGHIYTMKNRGATSLPVTGIALGGTDANQFVLATGGGHPCASLTPTLAAGASCTVTVAARPTTVGNKSAVLAVTTGVSSTSLPLTATAAMSVTYNGNGNSSGSVPGDSTAYATGATVTVLGNSGALAKSGYVFNDWSMAGDGSGLRYHPGATFTYTGVTTLYAQWATTIAPPSGLVSWWRGEGDAGDTAGGLTGTPTSGITYAAGKVGQAFSFTGTFNNVPATAYITVPDNPGLNFGTNEFSIAVWIKTTDTAAYQRLVTKRTYTGATAWYSLAANGGKVLFETGVNNITSTATVTDGLWHHIAVTRDPVGTSPRRYHLYIDGGEDAYVIDSGANLNSTAPLEIGKWFNENYYTGIYSGLMDEIQLFNRALTSAEVQNIYKAGSAGLALLPTITSISPSSGPATGGGQVVITGTHLANASLVKFGAIPAISFTVVSDTQITAIAPAGNVADIAVITVSTPGGASAAGSSCQFRYTGLVSWWKGEGNALDAVSALNGTVSLYAGYYPGKIGQAFGFSGNPAVYVTVPDNPKLNLGIHEFSLAVWVKATDTGTWKRIITKRPASGASAWYSLGVSGNKAIFEISAGVSITSSIPVADDTWHHIAVTRDPAGGSSRKYRLYIDGVEDVTRDDSGLNLDNSGPLEIAKWANEAPGGVIFYGYIDEVQLYNRALTAAEVLDNYHAVPGVSWPLIVTKTGSGTVTTNVSPGTLSWSDNTGSASYPDSTSLRLTATPENGSGFGSWSGDCSGTDTTCLLSMFAGHTASASFFVHDYVRLGTLTTTLYGTLNHAYAAAQPGDLIKALGRVFTEDLTLDRDLSVTLQGGYLAGFGSRSSNTTLIGTLTIGSGSLEVDQLVVSDAIPD